jgi:soluble lytic murein transglycosylase-like protein
MLYACAAAAFIALGAQGAAAKPMPFDPTGRALAAPARASKTKPAVVQQRAKKTPIASPRKLRKQRSVAVISSACALSRAERARRIGRTVTQALDEEAANAQLVAHAAHAAGVPINLALSVAYHESRLDTCAVSHTGVRGVMQVTTETAKWLGLNRNINRQNVMAGVKILQRAIRVCGEMDFGCLARRYNGSTPKEQSRWAEGVELASFELEMHLEVRPYLNPRKRPDPGLKVVMARGGELL